MADVEQAFEFVMKHEDPDLSGDVEPEPHEGKERFGVNSIAHPEAVAVGFYEMSRDDAFNYAKNLFVQGYWNGVHGDDIKDQTVANKFVDLAYNIGVSSAVKVMQRAINSLYSSMVVMVDGVVGPKTLEYINVEGPQLLVNQLKSYGMIYYDDVVRKKPELAKYKAGWYNRLEA